ncbi:MAG: stage II sporulation protein P [Clostridia bacterium]|nr:stage II sporulation protein P [Clostridia bacterium]
MGRKNSGSEVFFSILVSISLLSATLVFSEDLVNSLSNFTLSFFNLAVSAEEFKVETLKNASSAKTDVYNEVIGYGNGFEAQTETADTETPEDIERIMNEAVAAYASFKKTGDIEETKLIATSSNKVYGNVAVNNKTETKSVDIKKELSKKASFGEITKEEPYVLIYHTHTTEGYELLDKGWYSDDYNSRTKDISKTVVRVGDEIAERLEKSGFKVIHDKTIYDASYNGAYGRSLETVEKYLEKYPSIVVTLDVHRDAIHYDSGTKCKPTAEINGKKAAQVMIITGAEEGSIEDYPNWSQNLTFAIALQNKVEENYKGLMRPIFFCQRKYNMHATPCSLLLEMGTDANTLDEAVYSGRLIGDSLAELLEENM